MALVSGLAILCGYLWGVLSAWITSHLYARYARWAAHLTFGAIGVIALFALIVFALLDLLGEPIVKAFPIWLFGVMGLFMGQIAETRKRRNKGRRDVFLRNAPVLAGVENLEAEPMSPAATTVGNSSSMVYRNLILSSVALMIASVAVVYLDTDGFDFSPRGWERDPYYLNGMLHEPSDAELNALSQKKKNDAYEMVLGIGLLGGFAPWLAWFIFIRPEMYLRARRSEYTRRVILVVSGCGVVVAAIFLAIALEGPSSYTEERLFLSIALLVAVVVVPRWAASVWYWIREAKEVQEGGSEVRNSPPE